MPALLRSHALPGRYRSPSAVISTAKPKLERAVAEQRRAERRRERARAYYAANPNKFIKRAMRWQAENRERWLADRRRRQRKRYYDDRISATLRASRNDAKMRSIPHNISYADLKTIWTGTCPIFDVPFFTEDTGGQEGKTPCIVRIDEALGYTKDNVVVLSKDAAALRRSVSAKDWAEWLSTLSSE